MCYTYYCAVICVSTPGHRGTGLLGERQIVCIFDVRIFNPLAHTYWSLPLAICYRRNEQAKRRAYDRWVRQVKWEDHAPQSGTPFIPMQLTEPSAIAEWPHLKCLYSIFYFIYLVFLPIYLYLHFFCTIIIIKLYIPIFLHFLAVHVTMPVHQGFFPSKKVICDALQTPWISRWFYLCAWHSIYIYISVSLPACLSVCLSVYLSEYPMNYMWCITNTMN